MNLTTATPPVKTVISVQEQKLIKPARYQEIDGIDVLLEPVFKIEVKDVERWEVTTTYNGNSETHQFSSEENAQSFYGGFN